MFKFLDRLLPNSARGWLALGTFLLMVYILTLVAFVKELDTSQLFTALASGIVGSGFGSIVGYHFASSSGSSETRELAQSAINAVTSNNPPAPSKTTITVEENQTDVRPK